MARGKSTEIITVEPYRPRQEIISKGQNEGGGSDLETRFRRARRALLESGNGNAAGQFDLVWTQYTGERPCNGSPRVSEDEYTMAQLLVQLSADDLPVDEAERMFDALREIRNTGVLDPFH